jgi:hypothetical protein
MRAPANIESPHSNSSPLELRENGGKNPYGLKAELSSHRFIGEPLHFLCVLTLNANQSGGGYPLR